MTFSPRPWPEMVATTFALARPSARDELAGCARNREQTAKFHFGTDLGCNAFHLKSVARRDAILLAASLNYCVHRILLLY